MRDERSHTGPDEPRERLAWGIAELVAGAVTDPGLLFDRAAELVCEELAHSCTFAVLFHENTKIHPLGVFHRDEARLEALRSMSDLAWAPVEGVVEDIVTGNAPRQLDAAQLVQIAAAGAWTAALLDSLPSEVGAAVPMRGIGRTEGIMGVVRSSERGPFDGQEMRALRFVADRMGLAAQAIHLQDDVDFLRRAVTQAVDAGGALAALTGREREIFRAIGEGLTSREVAERLFLSVRTVEWHRARLMGKLGTTKRSDLIALARTLRP